MVKRRKRISKRCNKRNHSMNNYFTSDPHFFHYNIIKYCKRPFISLEEMHSAIIRNWNQIVKKEDTVYCIGDWGFTKSNEAYDAPRNCVKPIEEQLNGKIIVLQGNHDKTNHVKTIIQNMVIKIGGHKIFLVHDPLHANSNYDINFVGHVHNAWKFKKLTTKSIMINVGMDVWNFKPVTINQILSEYSTWKKNNEKK